MSLESGNYSLLFDRKREIVTVHGPSGRPCGTVTWKAVIDFIGGAQRRGLERRQHVRASLGLKVKYSAAEGRELGSITKDVSSGGLFIETTAPHIVGTDLVVQFALPDPPWEWILARARVVWIQDQPERRMQWPGMGVQFLEISDDARARIIELVSTLNRDRGGF